MLKVIVIIVLTTLVQSAPTNLDFEPVNQFALTLLDNVYAFQENFGSKNIALSPISIWSIFALLAEGASGQTFLELMKELKLPNDLRATQTLHVAVKDVFSDNQDVTLKRQGAMFADCSLEIHPEFCQSAIVYNTDIYSVDPSNTTKLADDINYYVCVATEGKIINAVTPDVLEDLRMILVDALYFKAPWTYPFDPTQTKEEGFYNTQGKTIGSVNMMHHKAPHHLGDAVQIGAQILEMTYGKNEQFSMLILLPFEGMPIKRLLNNLATQPLDWMSEYKTAGFLSDVDVFLPRFTISSKLNLIPPLKYTGIITVFDKSKAELPGVSDSLLYVSESIQNVEIQVSEEGTVAAASTVVGVGNRILGPSFEANREFVYLIMERKSNIILFSGVYIQPVLV